MINNARGSNKNTTHRCIRGDCEKGTQLSVQERKHEPLHGHTHQLNICMCALPISATQRDKWQDYNRSSERAKTAVQEHSFEPTARGPPSNVICQLDNRHFLLSSVAVARGQ